MLTGLPFDNSQQLAGEFMGILPNCALRTRGNCRDFGLGFGFLGLGLGFFFCQLPFINFASASAALFSARCLVWNMHRKRFPSIPNAAEKKL